MTPSEKHLLDMYFINQGLRLDMELSAARLAMDMKMNCINCMRLTEAEIRKEDFEKFQHDVCALLNFHSE